MKISIEFDLPAQFLKNVMVSALESGQHGTSTWATCVQISKGTGSDYSEVILHYDLKDEAEGNRAGLHKMGLAEVAEGIKRALSHGFELGSAVRGRIAQAVATYDSGEIDGPAADVIFQAAIYGEVVYG